MQSPSQQSWNRNGELQTEPVFFKKGFKKIEMLSKRRLHLKTEDLRGYELGYFYYNNQTRQYSKWAAGNHKS